MRSKLTRKGGRYKEVRGSKTQFRSLVELSEVDRQNWKESGLDRAQKESCNNETCVVMAVRRL